MTPSRFVVHYKTCGHVLHADDQPATSADRRSLVRVDVGGNCPSCQKLTSWREPHANSPRKA